MNLNYDKKYFFKQMMDSQEPPGRRPSFRVPTNGTADVGKTGKSNFSVGFNFSRVSLWAGADLQTANVCDSMKLAAEEWGDTLLVDL